MFPIFNHPPIGITPDESWRTLEVGDRARVRAHVPIYGERFGTLTEITDGMYHLTFDEGGSCVFDGDDLMAVKKRKKTFTYTEISPERLTATDLREEYHQHPNKDDEIYAYLVTIAGSAEQAQVLYFAFIKRMGIAWGADASWADVESAEDGIEMWLNEGEQWDQRN